MKNTMKIGEEVFDSIKARFPNLRFDRKEDVPAEIAYDVEVQDGLSVPIHLSLQNNDELHFCVGEHFWCEWFPCTKDYKRREYLDAVCGFVSGQHRVVEFWKFGRCSKAQLQKEAEGKWVTIACWGSLGIPIPFVRSKTKVIRNKNTEQGGVGQRR